MESEWELSIRGSQEDVHVLRRMRHNRTAGTVVLQQVRQTDYWRDSDNAIGTRPSADTFATARNILAGFLGPGRRGRLVLGNGLFPHIRQMSAPPEMPVSFLVVLFNTLGIVILAKAAIGFLGGWGLLQRDPWARVLLLTLAFLSLIHVPFGTALGVYTLWVMLPGPSEQEYQALIAAREAHASA